LRRYKNKALRVSFGEPKKWGIRAQCIKNSRIFRGVVRELLLAMDNAPRPLRRLGFIVKLRATSSSSGIEAKCELPEAPSIEFPGGVLKLIERTRDGYSARVYPRSCVNGTLVQAQILARMLRGIYPSSYSDQGDLIWKSVILRVERAMELLRDFKVDEKVKEELALESALRSTKLWPVLAILMAEDCTEAYAQLGRNLVIEHIVYGRIRVENYVLDEEDMRKLITFVEADPNSGFDFRRSLAEVDLALADHKFRIALDVPPSSRGALDIRNLSAMSKLSLPRLIELGTISEDEASLALESLETGRPLLIFGRTGVGKTTLANALLATLPRDWRLISVEEVREIEDLSIYGMHHSPYEIPHGKLDFIRFLLHRNPDLVFLGEVLTKEQAEAFELAHSSGLRVMATTHARGYEGLVKKWASWGLEIPEGTLAIFMERRRVADMMEWMGSWIPVEGRGLKWFSLLERLRGAHTNEEVGKRICELEGLRRPEQLVY